MGKQWKQWQTLFGGAPKSLQMVTAAMKLQLSPVLQLSNYTQHLIADRPDSAHRPGFPEPSPSGNLNRLLWSAGTVGVCLRSLFWVLTCHPLTLLPLPQHTYSGQPAQASLCSTWLNPIPQSWLPSCHISPRKPSWVLLHHLPLCSGACSDFLLL